MHFVGLYCIITLQCTAQKNMNFDKHLPWVISDFPRFVNEIFAFMGLYEAFIGSYFADVSALPLCPIFKGPPPR